MTGRTSPLGPWPRPRVGVPAVAGGPGGGARPVTPGAPGSCGRKPLVGCPARPRRPGEDADGRRLRGFSPSGIGAVLGRGVEDQDGRRDEGHDRLDRRRRPDGRPCRSGTTTIGPQRPDGVEGRRRPRRNWPNDGGDVAVRLQAARTSWAPAWRGTASTTTDPGAACLATSAIRRSATGGNPPARSAWLRAAPLTAPVRGGRSNGGRGGWLRRTTPLTM